MKQFNFPLLATLLVIVFTASSCDAIEGIFKAGMWTGVILIVLIVVLVLWLIGKTRRRR